MTSQHKAKGTQGFCVDESRSFSTKGIDDRGGCPKLSKFVQNSVMIDVPETRRIKNKLVYCLS